jgi:DNA-binding Xre family transcriptional regulator
MFKYNIKGLMRLRGIAEPYAFLKKHGFGDSEATRLGSEKMKYLCPRQVEGLCMALKCEPNDLYMWIPDKDEVVNDNHPLKNLLNKDAGSVTDLGKDIPVEKVIDFLKEARALEAKYKSQG